MLDDDTFQLNQMLKQPDKEEFVKAMDKKMARREGKYWKVVRRPEAIQNNTIKSMCSFKIKWLPSGEFTKNKAMTCAHGGMQS